MAMFVQPRNDVATAFAATLRGGVAEVGAEPCKGAHGDLNRMNRPVSGAPTWLQNPGAVHRRLRVITAHVAGTLLQLLHCITSNIKRGRWDSVSS
jgi:hypothetical protein